METLGEVEAAFAGLAGEYDFRKRLAESTVVTWRWATWSWFDPRPLHFERNGWAPGRPRARAPSDPNTWVSCGIDGEGRVVVERQFHEFGFETFAECFYRRSSSAIEVANFSSDREKAPINLGLVRLENGRPVSSDTAAVHGFTREEYHWAGARVEEVRVSHAERSAGILSPLESSCTAKAHYDDEDRLLRVEIHWPPTPLDRDGSIELMYERRGKRIYRKG